MKKFNVIFFWFCYYLEVNHRYMFDNVFIHGHINSTKDKINIRVNKFLFWLYPRFRTYIKYWSPIIKKAYDVKHIKSMQIFRIYRAIRYKNYKRYT
jgi:hypothetical protein